MEALGAAIGKHKKASQPRIDKYTKIKNAVSHAPFGGQSKEIWDKMSQKEKDEYNERKKKKANFEKARRDNADNELKDAYGKRKDYQRRYQRLKKTIQIIK